MVFENWVLRRIFRPKTYAGGNCTMRSFITSALPEIDCDQFIEDDTGKECIAHSGRRRMRVWCGCEIQ
jgi:hypothetical protein